jgi:hypothetical protein
MNGKMLNTLLLSKTKPIQLGIALFGAFLGLFIVMCGVQLYRNMGVLLQEKDMLGGDYIVLNKKVSLLNTISGNSPEFTNEEIAEIKTFNTVDNVGNFTAAQFKASMELDGGIAAMSGMAFKTEWFFETVPNEFVDIEKANRSWQKGETVPIIIPSDFIQLYNMAFARSQGLPVIPESILKTVQFKITLKGNGKSEEIMGKIAGFSQRINSILVPSSFLQYGNATYGTGAASNPSRIIIHTTDPSSPDLIKQIEEKGFDFNTEKLKAGKLNSILQIILGIVAFVGSLIVALALLGFMQYNQLLAYRSAYEIQTLHWLGYPIKNLKAPYFRFILLSIIITFLIAAIILLVVQNWFQTYLNGKGFPMQMPSIVTSISLGLFIALVMTIFSSFAAAKQVTKLSQ